MRPLVRKFKTLAKKRLTISTTPFYGYLCAIDDHNGILWLTDDDYQMSDFSHENLVLSSCRKNKLKGCFMLNRPKKYLYKTSIYNLFYERTKFNEIKF